MAPPRKLRGFTGLQQAFDEVRFGPDRTLNLRASLPTAAEAAKRIDSWLRQHQVQQSGELLLITGRGNNSEDGISVVREAAIRTFHGLRRKGVVQDYVEHTAGSFVVTPAPMQSMFDAAKHRGKQEALPPPAVPPTLTALNEETRRRLRVLAERSLDTLGVRDRGQFVENEMLRLFGILASGAGDGADREQRLRAAVDQAMSELE
jgi:hypothetical protein